MILQGKTDSVHFKLVEKTLWPHLLLINTDMHPDDHSSRHCNLSETYEGVHHPATSSGVKTRDGKILIIKGEDYLYL
jgi:hypothetical protein